MQGHILVIPLLILIDTRLRKHIKSGFRNSLHEKKQQPSLHPQQSSNQTFLAYDLTLTLFDPTSSSHCNTIIISAYLRSRPVHSCVWSRGVKSGRRGCGSSPVRGRDASCSWLASPVPEIILKKTHGGQRDFVGKLSTRWHFVPERKSICFPSQCKISQPMEHRAAPVRRWVPAAGPRRLEIAAAQQVVEGWQTGSSIRLELVLPMRLPYCPITQICEWMHVIETSSNSWVGIMGWAWQIKLF